jgi:thiol-disulfide isomerase/thioredoxin
MSLRKYMMAWGFFALIFLRVPPVMGQHTVADLLRTFDLSTYPPGMWPPPFTGQTITGRKISLADLKGRVVLVNFWASWCAACRPEMPMFERLHRDYTTQGLTVLGINSREEPWIVQRYAKELTLTFPLLLDPKGRITRLYGVTGLPTTFLVGRNGRPVALAVGAREWRSAEARAIIQALLAESVAQKEVQ